jgi:hypothetical protein
LLRAISIQRLSSEDRARWYFGIDLLHFWLRKGTKTPEKGPKSASSDYSSVNMAFLYIVHSLRLALDSGLKSGSMTVGVGVKAIFAGFLLHIDLKKVFPGTTVGFPSSSGRTARPGDEQAAEIVRLLCRSRKKHPSAAKAALILLALCGG